MNNPKLHSDGGWSVCDGLHLTSYYKDGFHCPFRQCSFLSLKVREGKRLQTRQCVSKLTGMCDIFESFVIEYPLI